MGIAQPVYLVIGCPGAGKSWVCEQLRELYDYVRHDDYMDGGYVDAIIRQHAIAAKPLLIETPFSVSQIKEPLEKKGLQVVPVFILEAPEVVSARYLKREGVIIPTGHLTRQLTYRQRAKDWHAFHGTAEQILEFLRNAAPRKRLPWDLQV